MGAACCTERQGQTEPVTLQKCVACPTDRPGEPEPVALQQCEACPERAPPPVVLVTAAAAAAGAAPPGRPLTLSFLKPDGGVVDVVFPQRPVGLECEKTLPLSARFDMSRRSSVRAGSTSRRDGSSSR
mmetsp:Transcript_81502/g.253009  ORF Transcript_81502/g.253009 Transcript_81502/m.253009 type:complete len:128 (+) Transcript_81502:56-439(+)